MSITLTPDIEDRIRAWIDTGHFPDADAVVAKALRALEDQAQAQFVKLRELVLAGRDSGSAGELTPELLDEIEREAEQAYQRGEQPSPHVRP